MEKIIETHLSRKFTVQSGFLDTTHIGLQDTTNATEIDCRLTNADAVELGEAIIKAAGKKAFVFEGRMPGSAGDGKTVVKSGHFTYALDANPDLVLEEIKALITIRDVLIFEAEEKKKRESEEALTALKLKSRRDELTKEFCGDVRAGYIHLSSTAKAAVDRVIELEGKLEAKNA